MLFLLTALFLSAWFWRLNYKDASLWMLLTYAGIGALAYTDYQNASVLSEAFPKILKDFILLGMIGFVQNLAIHKRISILTAVITILGLFAAAHFLEDYLPADDTPFLTADLADPGLLVELAEGADDTALMTYAAARGFSLAPAFSPKYGEETLLDNFMDLDIGTADAESIIRELAGIKGVTYVEPNEVILVEPMIESTDVVTATGNRSSLGINDPGVEEQWAMEALDMTAYYQLLARQRPKKRARIAILDTGIDGRHEDLTDNYFSVEKRYDNDPMGHGTHCAGIAAGVTNNGLGIGSLAGPGNSPFVEITSIKVLSAGGQGTQKSIIAGIIEAVDENVDVISLSLGGVSNQSRERAYSQAVKYATDRGVIVVAAAGNSNRPATGYAPANAKGIITVAALDPYLLRAPFSNRTDGIAQPIAAPGVGIFSTVPDNNYRKYSGTSMACPFVAGLLGVMKSINPELSPKAAYEIIRDSGKSTNETRVTGRIVQPAAALRATLAR